MSGTKLTTSLVIEDKTSKALDKISQLMGSLADKTDVVIDKIESLDAMLRAFDLQKIERLEGRLDGVLFKKQWGKQIDKVANIGSHAGIFDSLGRLVENSVRSMTTGFDNSANAAGRARDAVDSLNYSISSTGSIAETVGTGASSSFDGFKNSATNVLSKLQLVKEALGVISSTVLPVVDENTNITARLGAIARKEGIDLEDSDKWHGRAKELRKQLTDKAIQLGADPNQFMSMVLSLSSNPAFKSIDEVGEFSSLVSKQFTASGVTGQAQASVMMQLTQGLARGVLQGQDLMSVLSNAPDMAELLEKAYARVNDVSFTQVKGKVRSLASEGKLTADVIKDAFFGAADEINTNFEEMPWTFEDMLSKLKGSILETLHPVLDVLGEFGNSELFKGMLQSVGSVISSLVSAAEPLAPMISVFAKAIAGSLDNISRLIGILPSLMNALAPFIELNAKIMELSSEAIGTVGKYTLEIAGFYISGISDLVAYLGNSFHGRSTKQDEPLWQGLEDVYDVNNQTFRFVTDIDEKLEKMGRTQGGYLASMDEGLREMLNSSTSTNETLSKILDNTSSIAKTTLKDKVREDFYKKYDPESVRADAYNKAILDGATIGQALETADQAAKENPELFYKSEEEWKKAKEAYDKLPSLEELNAQKIELSHMLETGIDELYGPQKRRINEELFKSYEDNKFMPNPFDPRLKLPASSQYEDRENAIAYKRRDQQLDELSDEIIATKNEIGNRLLQIYKDIATKEALSASLSDQERMWSLYLRETRDEAKAISRNTRKVKIDKDSILFMKQMATAEIINKYNTVNSTVNTNFNSNERYTTKEVKQLSGAMVSAAVGAVRG